MKIYFLRGKSENSFSDLVSDSHYQRPVEGKVAPVKKIAKRPIAYNSVISCANGSAIVKGHPFEFLQTQLFKKELLVFRRGYVRCNFSG